MKKRLFIFLFFTKIAFAQSNFPIDTSYTVKSVYDKVKKEHPYISYVASRKYKSVNQKKEIVYRKIKERELHLDVYYNNTKKRKNQWFGNKLHHYTTPTKTRLPPCSSTAAYPDFMLEETT